MTVINYFKMLFSEINLRTFFFVISSTSISFYVSYNEIITLADIICVLTIFIFNSNKRIKSVDKSNRQLKRVLTLTT